MVISVLRDFILMYYSDAREVSSWCEQEQNIKTKDS